MERISIKSLEDIGDREVSRKASDEVSFLLGKFGVMYLCSQHTQLTKTCSNLITETLGTGVISKTSKTPEKIKLAICRK